MPFNIGAPELIILLIIALVVIGPGRLPDVGAALGKSIREFRKASTDITEAARIDTSPLPPSAAPAPTPQAPMATPTASTVPAPIVTPPAPSDDESSNLPA
jgi:sec-independent protein translocase protein TatA